MSISEDRNRRHSNRVGRRVVSYNNLAYGGPGRFAGPVDSADAPKFPEPKRKRVRILAEYDLFGDISTELWEKEYLDAALEMDLVDSTTTLCVLTGAFGLRRVVFFVDALLVVGEEEFMKNEAYEILCNIVREQDVRVSFLAPLT
jgi:hypothetical protein